MSTQDNKIREQFSEIGRSKKYTKKERRLVRRAPIGGKEKWNVLFDTFFLSTLMSGKRKSSKPLRSVPPKKRIKPDLQTDLIDGSVAFRIQVERW